MVVFDENNPFSNTVEYEMPSEVTPAWRQSEGSKSKERRKWREEGRLGGSEWVAGCTSDTRRTFHI